MTKPTRWSVLAPCIAPFALVASNLMAAGMVDPALPAYRPEYEVKAELNSIGDNTMKHLMDAWWLEFQQRQPAARQGARGYSPPQRPGGRIPLRSQPLCSPY